MGGRERGREGEGCFSVQIADIYFSFLQLLLNNYVLLNAEQHVHIE